MKHRTGKARDLTLYVGTGIAVTAIVVAIVAPWLAPTDPLSQTNVLQTRFLPPLATGPDGIVHWFGTDRFGRDILSRMIYGTRISLLVGFVSVFVSLLAGVGIGMGAALAGGQIERWLMAFTDAMLALPRLVLLLFLVAIFEPSLMLVIVVLGATGWMSVARLVRSEVKSLLGRSFVDAARAYGLPTTKLVGSHLLPNALTPVLVAGALAVGNAITLESGLAFLGLGVPPPAPSWGSMIAGGRDAIVFAPWIAFFPGVAIAAIVVSCNLIGDALRDRWDPTTQ